MNYHTSTSQYNMFLSSITYCIWRVTSLGSVLLVCEVVRSTSKSSFHFMSAGTPTIQLSKNITWWTVYVNVCLYIYIHIHTFVVLCLHCSCTIKLVDKLHTVSNSTFIIYITYSKAPHNIWQLCICGINNKFWCNSIDMNINNQGTKHQWSLKNYIGFPWSSNWNIQNIKGNPPIFSDKGQLRTWYPSKISLKT